MTVHTRQVNDPRLNKGKPTLIPSIWDGKKLGKKASIDRAVNSGIKWTTIDSHPELREHDKKLHKDMKPLSSEDAKKEYKKQESKYFMS